MKIWVKCLQVFQAQLSYTMIPASWSWIRFARYTAKYINPNIFVSATHTSRCACLSSLSLIILIYFIAQSPRLFGSQDFWPFLPRFWAKLSGEDQRTLWLRHARGTWQKELHLMSQLHVSCHPIKYIQNRMRALRILKDTTKGFLLIELWNMVKPTISKCLNVRRCLDLKVLESMMPLMAGSFETNARVRWLRSSCSISVQRPVWQFDSCSGRSIFVPI